MIGLVAAMKVMALEVLQLLLQLLDPIFKLLLLGLRLL